VKKGIQVTVSSDSFDAVIFDLDGVVTDTASIHAGAWKKMFDDFLFRYVNRKGVPFQPFETDSDYLLYVDGKPRLDGVRSFLGSRGIELPEGGPQDEPGVETIHGLGRQKNAYFLKHVQEYGADVYESTVDLIHSMKKHGLKTAIISSSKSCAMILDVVNLSDLFDVRVDGVDSKILGIPGKPAPDIFIEASRQLKVKPERAVVVEDAISGVRAGRAGKFGLVIGIARTGDKESLLENGADVAIEDLSEVCVMGDLKTSESLNLGIPRGLPQLFMRIKYRGNWFDITATPQSMTIASGKGELHSTKLLFQNKIYELESGESLTFDVGQGLPRAHKPRKVQARGAGRNIPEGGKK